jgi:fructokinase
MESVALVVGEALIDVVRGRDGSERDHPGGSAANAAIALSRLGREVWFATAWAADAHGELLADHLRAGGIRLAGDPLVLERTATAVATLGEDGAASYDFDIAWRLPPLDLGATDPAVVMWGSIGAVLEPGAGAVHTLVASLRHRALTSYDVNARPGITGAGPEVVARVEAMAALADLVKASDEDLTALWPGRSEDTVVGRLLDAGARAVIVTRGAGGASWRSQDLQVDVPVVSTDVVDTIGAGDTLGAAAVDELWRRGVAGPRASDRLARLGRDDARAVLEWAMRAAAVTVSRPGADPPTRAELRDASRGRAR